MKEDNGLHPIAQAAAEAAKVMSTHKVRIRWRGTKSPIGASVGGVAVAFARHDTLFDASGLPIGRYDRVSEFTGAERDEHEMVVSAKADVSFPGAMLIEPVPA